MCRKLMGLPEADTAGAMSGSVAPQRPGEVIIRTTQEHLRRFLADSFVLSGINSNQLRVIASILRDCLELQRSVIDTNAQRFAEGVVHQRLQHFLAKVTERLKPYTGFTIAVDCGTNGASGKHIVVITLHHQGFVIVLPPQEVPTKNHKAGADGATIKLTIAAAMGSVGKTLGDVRFIVVDGASANTKAVQLIRDEREQAETATNNANAGTSVHSRHDPDNEDHFANEMARKKLEELSNANDGADSILFELIGNVEKDVDNACDRPTVMFPMQQGLTVEMMVNYLHGHNQSGPDAYIKKITCVGHGLMIAVKRAWKSMKVQLPILHEVVLRLSQSFYMAPARRARWVHFIRTIMVDLHGDDAPVKVLRNAITDIDRHIIAHASPLGTTERDYYCDGIAARDLSQEMLKSNVDLGEGSPLLAFIRQCALMVVDDCNKVANTARLAELREMLSTAIQNRERARDEAKSMSSSSPPLTSATRWASAYFESVEHLERNCIALAGFIEAEMLLAPPESIRTLSALINKLLAERNVPMASLIRGEAQIFITAFLPVKQLLTKFCDPDVRARAHLVVSSVSMMRRALIEQSEQHTAMLATCAESDRATVLRVIACVEMVHATCADPTKWYVSNGTDNDPRIDMRFWEVVDHFRPVRVIRTCPFTRDSEVWTYESLWSRVRDAFLTDMFTTIDDVTHLRTHEKIKDEFNAYIADVRSRSAARHTVDDSVLRDPVMYWSSSDTKAFAPELAAVAFRLLHIPPVVLFVDSFFSVLGSMVNERRAASGIVLNQAMLKANGDFEDLYYDLPSFFCDHRTGAQRNKRKAERLAAEDDAAAAAAADQGLHATEDASSPPARTPKQ
jgi:hypothetical protein